ncbi:MAG: hypothetical protein AAGB46_06520 [Verrucomicrobiota bacterium]
MWLGSLFASILIFQHDSLVAEIGFATFVMALLIGTAYVAFPYWQLYRKNRQQFEKEENSSACANLSILLSFTTLLVLNLLTPIETSWNLAPVYLFQIVSAASYILAIVLIILSAAKAKSPIWLPQTASVALALSLKLTF